MEHVALRDMDDWHSFVAANEDALLDMYSSIDDALKAACEGGIVIGGGAASAFLVSFVD